MVEMTIVWKGQQRQVSSNITLGKFLQAEAVTTQGVAISVNKSFVPRDQHAVTALQPNDEIECIVPMQGG